MDLENETAVTPDNSSEGSFVIGRPLGADSALEKEPARSGGDLEFGLTASNHGVSHRSKSALRLKYEAEVSLMKRKLGSLEDIREKLGLTQRKISQLLLVDPSAWTRWTKTEDEAPPHIYRMLQWYLALEEKYPTLDVNFWLSSVARVGASAGDLNRDEKIQRLSGRVGQLDSEIAHLKRELESARLQNAAPVVDPPESVRKMTLLIVAALIFVMGVLLGSRLF